MHCPQTYLDNAAKDLSLVPTFLRRAALEQDPVERMKLVIANYIGTQHINVTYTQARAPLNPILGETL